MPLLALHYTQIGLGTALLMMALAALVVVIQGIFLQRWFIPAILRKADQPAQILSGQSNASALDPGAKD